MELIILETTKPSSTEALGLPFRVSWLGLGRVLVVLKSRPPVPEGQADARCKRGSEATLGQGWVRG